MEPAAHPTATLLGERASLTGLLGELAAEAARYRFEVAPNPTVGAAVLAGGKVIARGFHEYWGGPHAEINALEAAQASGVPPSAWEALAVTLEPCTSYGKTPPCSAAIVRTPILSIACGSLDPDPRERGRSAELLQAAGRAVRMLDCTPIARVAPYFLRWTARERLRRPRPWTIAKWAQTRSGQLVPPAEVGQGRWITGPRALAQVQILRGRVDAIVSGVSTVRADDPRLTLRPAPERVFGTQRAPLRVILDSFLRTPPEARLFEPAGRGEFAGEVHILCQAGADGARHRALEARGARITGLHSSEPTRLSLREVQEWLWQQGARRVLLETGPELLGRYLQAGFVDQVRVYTGHVSGGQGESMAEALGRLKLGQRLDGEVGDDSVFEAFVEDGPAD